jgi:hypothetical protein
MRRRYSCRKFGCVGSLVSAEKNLERRKSGGDALGSCRLHAIDIKRHTRLSRGVWIVDAVRAARRIQQTHLDGMAAEDVSASETCANGKRERHPALSLLSEKRRGQAGAMMQPDYQEAGVLSMLWSPEKH